MWKGRRGISRRVINLRCEVGLARPSKRVQMICARRLLRPVFFLLLKISIIRKASADFLDSVLDHREKPFRLRRAGHFAEGRRPEFRAWGNTTRADPEIPFYLERLLPRANRQWQRRNLCAPRRFVLLMRLMRCHEWFSN